MNKINIHNLKDIFISSFFASIFLGFIVFSAYFINIKYFPTSGLISLIYLPVIVGVSFFLIVISLMFLFGLAPYSWTELLQYERICSRIVDLQYVNEVIKSYKSGRIVFNSKLKGRICLFYILYMSVDLLIWGLTISFLKEDFLIIPSVLGLFGTHWLVMGSKDTSNLVIQNKKIAFIVDITKILCYSLLPSLGIFVVAIFFARLGQFDVFYFIMFVVCMTVISSLCLAPISTAWKTINWTVVVALCTITFFLFMLGLFTSLSTNIVGLFKFGDILNTAIVIDQEGCDIFRLNGFNIDCSGQNKRYKVDGINILWRVNEYYIQDGSREVVKFIVPKKHVVSFSAPLEIDSSNTDK